MKDVDYNKYLEDIEPRIEWLKKNHKYIEAFLLLISHLERELQFVVEFTESIVTDRLSNSGFSYNLKKTRKIEDLTIGQLIDRFEVYYKDYNDLGRLREINKLRIKCVHGLYKNKLIDLEKNIIDQLPEIYDMIANLLDIIINLKDKKSKVSKK